MNSFKKGVALDDKSEMSNLKCQTVALLRKHLDHFLNSAHQNVNLFLRIVESKRGAGGSRDLEPLHHGLSTMVAGTYCDSFLVQDGADVVRVHLIDYKG